MGIWAMFMAVRLSFWLVTGLAAAALLRTTQQNGRPSTGPSALVVLWLAAVCWSSWRYYDAGSALTDAAAASTSPDRLHELASFNGIQAGYELDNRIASNPNTNPDTLRVLYGRGQAGTEMCLARNPNTPDDILGELATRDGDGSRYIVDALKRNPRYEEVFGDSD